MFKVLERFVILYAFSYVYFKYLPKPMRYCTCSENVSISTTQTAFRGGRSPMAPRMYPRCDRLPDNVMVRPGNTVDPKDRIDRGLATGKCN